MRICTAMLISALSGVMVFSAAACPLGTHPVGGEGSHYKGGHCTKRAAEYTRDAPEATHRSVKQTDKTSRNDRKHKKDSTHTNNKKSEASESRLNKKENE
ncbi:hypothetical protein EcCFBP13530_23700 [Enterobacter cancerogenus]|uniref:Lipoprotein n=1 Tax=Enterobacter cancerogenus TaxID=69218 RepID=A0AB38NZA5_9ENTR|nr:hypothetical protein EcCFBP13530_23700 [Enterobacter cancerogenus]